MADTFSVEVDSVEFESAMQRLRKAVDDGIMNPQYGLLTVQARLLAEKCQDLTPPIGRQGSSTQSAWQSGRTAVTRDLSVIFRPLSQKTFEDKSIRKIVRKGDNQAWNKVSPFFKGSLRNTRAIVFDPKWHDQNRISRGRGRRGKGTPPNIGVVTIGSSASLARSYMKDTRQHVGWARAGWNTGILNNSGEIGANWIRKHGMGRGFCHKTLNGDNPFVWVGNTTKWAQYGSQGEGNRILRNAIAFRARDMEKHVNTMARIAAESATKEYALGAHSTRLIL